jgi:branched-chain amino acid transport system permease protein
LTIFAIVIFGGMANLTGSVLASIIIVMLDPFLKRVLKLNADKSFVVQLIIYGAALTLLMRLRPQGVFPEGFSLWKRLRHGRPSEARIEMNAEDWVPDTNVTIREGDHEPTHGEQGEREARWQNAPVVLQARGISKSFGGIVAAENLDIDLRKGTITALVGPNGAGKTTVFNLLTGFIRPDRGSVVLNGIELVGRTPDAVARMGLVRSFQDVRLIQRVSCVTNVMLAVQGQPGEHLVPLFTPGKTAKGEDATRDKAMGWLRFVGMADFADVLAGALSYGQSKLLSLARALATEADVLLLDEPASGIDTKWVDTMLDLIEAVREQGRTVCIVEHNLHVVGRLADHTYFMELGRITAQGTIDELTGSERLAEAYFGT